jgi:hypothetical protein
LRRRLAFAVEHEVVRPRATATEAMRERADSHVDRRVVRSRAATAAAPRILCRRQRAKRVVGAMISVDAIAGTPRRGGELAPYWIRRVLR